MNKIKLLVGVAAIGLATLIVGCKTSSFNASVFQSENIAADTATGATHAINTVAAGTFDAAKLAQAKAQVYEADKQLSAILAITDALRTNYVANANSTNQAAVLVALQSVQNQSTNIVKLVQGFLNSTT
jgi:hypothetical protein